MTIEQSQQSREWLAGWNACAESTRIEVEAAYQLGLRRSDPAAIECEWLGWAVTATLLVIVAFVLGVWIA